jgi:hypothetical protein
VYNRSKELLCQQDKDVEAEIFNSLALTWSRLLKRTVSVAKQRF